MDIKWLEVLAVAAVAIPLVLFIALIGHSIPLFWRFIYRHWCVKRSGIKYELLLGQPPLPAPNRGIWEANKAAKRLASRLLSVPELYMDYGSNGFHVTGGYTGHRYHIMPRALFPINDLTGGELLCGKPFNAWNLPMADVMLTQALYLQCATTERAFVALCNKTTAPSTPFVP